MMSSSKAAGPSSIYARRLTVRRPPADARPSAVAAQSFSECNTWVTAITRSRRRASCSARPAGSPATWTSITSCSWSVSSRQLWQRCGTTPNRVKTSRTRGSAEGSAAAKTEKQSTRCWGRRRHDDDPSRAEARRTAASRPRSGVGRLIRAPWRQKGSSRHGNKIATATAVQQAPQLTDPPPPVSGTKATGNSARSWLCPDASFSTSISSWLSGPSPCGITRRPPGLSCATRAGGIAARGGGHQDAIERRPRRAAGGAVADREDDVAVARRLEPRPRLERERLDHLDRHDLGGEIGQDRGLVARAGADLEHPRAGLQAQQMGHQRDHQRLRDGLAMADRQRPVVVGLRPRGPPARSARAAPRAAPRARAGRGGRRRRRCRSSAPRARSSRPAHAAPRASRRPRARAMVNPAARRRASGAGSRARSARRGSGRDA